MRSFISVYYMHYVQERAYGNLNQRRLMLGPPCPYVVGQCFGGAISLQRIPLYLIMLLVSDLVILKLGILSNNQFPVYLSMVKLH